MKDTKEFLTSGPVEVLTNPLYGIKFISIPGPLEFIGEIVEIVDRVAIVKSPFLLGRDTKVPNNLNFIPFHRINPIVVNQIEVPLQSISFLCSPRDEFIKQYKAARSGLVTAVSVNLGSNRGQA
jgi:hypothetical protein